MVAGESISTMQQNPAPPLPSYPAHTGGRAPHPATPGNGAGAQQAAGGNG